MLILIVSIIACFILNISKTSNEDREFWWDEIELEGGCYDTEVCLPKGSIRKLIGRDLDWNDEPVELK